MLPRNGKALSQPHDAWPVLALDAYLPRCRDKAGPEPPCPVLALPEHGPMTPLVTFEKIVPGGFAPRRATRDPAGMLPA